MAYGKCSNCRWEGRLCDNCSQCRSCCECPDYNDTLTTAIMQRTILLQGRAAWSAHQSHKLKVAGSNPAPATTFHGESDRNARLQLVIPSREDRRGEYFSVGVRKTDPIQTVSSGLCRTLPLCGGRGNLRSENIASRRCRTADQRPRGFGYQKALGLRMPAVTNPLQTIFSSAWRNVIDFVPLHQRMDA